MKKLINALLALALAAQLAVPMTAMAEGEAEATTTSYYKIDFSTNVQLKKNENKDGMGFQYFKGQYGKGKDDKSLRVYSLGKARASQDTYMLTHPFPAAVQGDETNNIGHVSFEYLLEDAGSGHRIELVGQKSDGESTYVTLINHDRRNPTAPSLCNKTSGAYTVGTWGKIDVYFTTGATGATVYNNGTPYNVTAADFSTFANMTGIQIKHSHFNESEAASPIASAVQFDNFEFEYVSSIPNAQEYRYIGESFNFDDGFIYSAGMNAYNIKNNTATVRKFTRTLANSRAVDLYGVDGSISFEDGIGGNPAWNTSYHYSNGGDKSHVMTYRTGVTDLKSGDYGHLSFMINSKGKYAVAQVNTDSTYPMVFSDSSTLDQTIFDFGSTKSNGLSTFKFFGQNTSITPALNTWYKIDMVYKIGNGTNTYTTVDCYVNGQLALADVEVKANDNYGAVLNHIGALKFVQPATADVYFDDIAFGVFTEDTLHDPTAGYSITPNNDIIGSCIDNTNRVIVLDEGYAVDKFLSEVDGNVTVYNDEGLIVTTGTMGGCSVKVSNGFGGGVWYNIADSAVIVEDNFNSGISSSKVTNLLNSYYNNPTAAGGLGGKAEDDLAVELDETVARVPQAVADNRFYVDKQDVWKSNTVVLEGSFLLKTADSSLTMQIAANKINSNLNYVIDFRANGEMRTMFRSGSIEELWKPNRWYKIAAVMEYGSRNIKIYLNGDEIWNGEYVQLVDSSEAAFIEGGSGFECLSRIRFLYNGQVAMDNLRISYGAYDPTKDKIDILGEGVKVNNEKSIIGFDGGVVENEYSADDLLGCFDESVGMRVYTDGTLATEANEITEDTIALVSMGEVFKYYEMGYITKQLAEPTIEFFFDELTATAELEETALKTPTSTAVLILAVYGENGLEQVIPVTESDVAAREDDLTATITPVNMEGKTAKAFLWDTTSSMIPLYEAVDYPPETEE